MTKILAKSAVSPVRRRFDVPPSLPRVDEVVAAERPDEPLHCLRPARDRRGRAAFVAGFPGSVLYAVKCNPEPRVLRALWAGGIRHFDCASPAEIALVRQMFPRRGDPLHASGQVAGGHPRGGGSLRRVRLRLRQPTDELEKILAETEIRRPADRGLFCPSGGRERRRLRPDRQVRSVAGRRRPPSRRRATARRPARPMLSRRLAVP